MDAVVSLHHDSPAQETKDLPRAETMPPGREGKGGQEWLDRAALEDESPQPAGRAPVPGSSEDGQAVGCLQCPQVMEGKVSLACLWPKARHLEQGLVHHPVQIVGQPEGQGLCPHMGQAAPAGTALPAPQPPGQPHTQPLQCQCTQAPPPSCPQWDGESAAGLSLGLKPAEGAERPPQEGWEEEQVAAEGQHLLQKPLSLLE